MRPLNRPMFRYGGPIKEGVMSGIREPKRKGGAALVGNPLFPKDASGRARHGWWIPLGMAGRALIGQGVKKVGQQGVKKVIQGSTPKNMQGIFVQGTQKAADKGIPAAATGWKNIGKNWFSGDPLVRGSKWGWKTLTSPGANTLAQKAVKMAISPTTVIGGTLYYLWPDGTKRKTPPPGGTGGATGPKPWEANVGMKGDGSWFDAQAEKEANIAKQKEWEGRIKKYRDIMDIKGMNKEAAYKSLIDASKLIQESGDFKGDIKSGKLINQVIQAASKQFDKPAKTSDAINTLILQNELKKDLNKEENALAKTLTQKKILLADKQLAGTSLNEEIGAYRTKHGKNPSGAYLEGILLDKDIPVEAVADTVEVDAHIKKGGDEVSFIESIVQANIEQGKPVTPGVYIVKDKVIVIDENGNVKKKR